MLTFESGLNFESFTLEYRMVGGAIPKKWQCLLGWNNFVGSVPMVITVFRSRVKPEVQEEYARWVGRMRELATSMPGFISHKGFVADDGERVAIVEFESEAAQRAWATHPEHIEAQKKGRKDFYLEFRIQVCTLQRESAHPRNRNV